LQTWSSRMGFLLASVGAAVGIGNIWRFSAVVGQNGGGAYLIPYLISIVAFAIPLMILELAAGRHFKGTVVAAFSAVHRRLATVGWLIYTIVFCILSYYLVITGWILAYLVAAILDRDLAFDEFTGTLEPLVYFLIASVLTVITVSLGVREGIERLSRYVMPLAFLILIGLVIYAFTLSGFGDAASFLVSPDFAVLGEPSIWSAAVGQAFFSLSVGFAVLMVFAAYLDPDANIVSLAGFIAIADLAVAVLAGLVIFPIVFTQGLEPTLGAQLAFTTLPTAFNTLPGGQLIGIAFFLMVFLAALTSAVSMLEANVAAVMESTGRSRRFVAAALFIPLLGLGAAPALSYTSLDLTLADSRVLDFMDDTLGTFGLPISALILAVVFRWFTKQDLLRTQIGTAIPSRFTAVLSWLTKYAIPPVLMLILVSRMVSDSPFAGWHILPDTPLLGTLTRDVAVFVMLPLLLASTLFVVRVVLGRREA
jgi:neurotransmitter:Na+ symporter, NSS family